MKHKNIWKTNANILMEKNVAVKTIKYNTYKKSKGQTKSNNFKDMTS